VLFDPRGNGASGRPVGGEHYRDAVLVDDAVAVLDVTGTARAALVGLSRGGRFTAMLAARHPHRVRALVLIAPSISLGHHPRFDPAHYRSAVDDPQGWEKCNAGHWLADWPDFVDFFMREVFVEPHSTKPIEDAVAWGLQTTGATIVDTMHPLDAPDAYRAMLRDLRCPVLVVQGTRTP
jgi:pimeloyl-ACP methyl ester carboxylesterase